MCFKVPYINLQNSIITRGDTLVFMTTKGIDVGLVREDKTCTGTQCNIAMKIYVYILNC